MASPTAEESMSITRWELVKRPSGLVCMEDFELKTDSLPTALADGEDQVSGWRCWACSPASTCCSNCGRSRVTTTVTIRMALGTLQVAREPAHHAADRFAAVLRIE